MEEKNIISSAEPVNIEGTKKILEQLMNCICKIKLKGEYGTGFFCKITFEKKIIKVLMTNHHVLNENNFKENKKLNLLLNDEKELRIIDLEIKRETYFNKDYDLAVIELKENDNIVNYLELDDDLFKNNADIIYLDKSLYVLQYPNGDKACVSYGLLNNINKYNIYHKCSTDKGSSGSPILNLRNNKVIGVHRKSSHFDFNIGTLLNFPLKDFINNQLKNMNSIIESQKNRVEIQSNTTKFFKYELPQELKNEMQYQAQEIIQKANENFFNLNNNNAQGMNQNQNLGFNQNQNQNFYQFNQFQNNNNPNNFINSNNNMNNCQNNNFIKGNNDINMNNFGKKNMNMNNNNMLGLNNIPSCNNMQILNIQNLNNHPNLNLIKNNPGNLLNNQIQNQVSSIIQSAPKENMFTSGINYPHKAGLLNVGQSCYMNATIQCLSNIKGLSHNILLNFSSFDPERQPLCLAYSNLIYELLHAKDKYINPKLFIYIIEGLNPLFKGNQAGDAKDLIFFIIETLHKELLPPPIINRNEIDFFQQEMNSNNERMVFQNFLTELSANQTIVSNIFYGAIRTVMVCDGCNRNKFSFQTFNLLDFPLKKVKDFKLEKIGCKKNINLDLNLYDAFACEQEWKNSRGKI